MGDVDTCKGTHLETLDIFKDKNQRIQLKAYNCAVHCCCVVHPAIVAVEAIMTS